MRSFNEFLKERDEDLYSEFELRFGPKAALAGALGLAGLGLGLGPGGMGTAPDQPTPIVQQASPEELVKQFHGMTDHEVEALKKDHTFDYYLKQAKRGKK